MAITNMLPSGDKSTTGNISFTKDQQKAIDNILDFIATPFNPAKYIVGLIGAGGVGKTFITNYIITHCKYPGSVIKCTSPTHKACRVFSQAIRGKNVDTVQSTFGLRLDLKLEDFDPVRPQFNPMGKANLDNIKLLLIDEASMIPAKLVTFINKECKQRNIKIIYIGDDKQLAPVNEKRSIAFTTCFQVNRLTQIIRQKDNNPIRQLLELLRNDIDNKSYGFITYISQHLGDSVYNDSNCGYTICNPNAFKELIDISFNDKRYTENIDMYRIIGYTNNCVAGWNNYIRNNIIKDSDKAIITKNDLIMSYETIVNEFNEVVINNSEEYIIHNIVNFTDSDYQFKGFLVKFQLVHGGKITTPLFILDHKDKYTVLKYHQTITELMRIAKNSTSGTRVKNWQAYYKFKKKYILAANIIDSTGKIIFSRDIDYGFAITSHKSQGSTYDCVFVDVNNMVYTANGRPYANIDDMLRRLYVGCSRARKELILCYGK